MLVLLILSIFWHVITLNLLDFTRFGMLNGELKDLLFVSPFSFFLFRQLIFIEQEFVVHDVIFQLVQLVLFSFRKISSSRLFPEIINEALSVFGLNGQPLCSLLVCSLVRLFSHILPLIFVLLDQSLSESIAL